MIRRPPRSTLFPSPPLSRSAAIGGIGEPPPRRLTALLPWDSAALPLMGERSEPIEPFGMMWRINDLAGLLRQGRAGLEQRLASAPFPAARRGAARIVLSSDHDGVTRAGSPEGLRVQASPR